MTQTTNFELMSTFVDTLLQKCCEKKMICEYEEEVYLSNEDSIKLDELLCKQKLIESKINRYKQEKLKAMNIIKGFKLARNLKDHLPRVLEKNIIKMISSTALSKLLETSFAGEKHIEGLIAKMNELCKQNNATICNVSDTDEKIFDSEEERILQESTSRKSTKRSKTTRRLLHKKRRLSENTQCEIASDLFLSSDEDN